MGRPLGWAAAATGRAAMYSPGRPPVSRREHRKCFWEAIARGVTSEEAGANDALVKSVGRCGDSVVHAGECVVDVDRLVVGGVPLHGESMCGAVDSHTHQRMCMQTDPAETSARPVSPTGLCRTTLRVRWQILAATAVAPHATARLQIGVRAERDAEPSARGRVQPRAARRHARAGIAPTRPRSPRERPPRGAAGRRGRR
jgi:hypothetical protein